MTRRPAQPIGAVFLVVSVLSGAASAQTKRGPDALLSAEAVNAAAFMPPGEGGDPGRAEASDKGDDGEAGPTARKSVRDERPDPLVVKAQVLLDRARFYPGAIDGRTGDNYRRALRAFAASQGVQAGKAASGGLTLELWEKLRGVGDAPALRDYTITEADAAGSYVDRIPRKMEAQADLKAMGYTDPREMLAERFHMGRDLLSALNPGKALDKAGTVIAVAAVEPMGTDRPSAKDLPRDPKVERVEVDKGSRDVRAFGSDGKLLAYYPASIGSREKPAPSGETKVKGVAFNPDYTYNPKYAFKGVRARRKFSIKPGPNNPVGLVWIDLALPSYGIHGTPEPENVGKTESHGCIRLTNWNARELAAHVARGARVRFNDE